MTHPQLSAAWRIEMGGFHDQYGNYRPDLVADARQAGIDRLCAELANARLERDGVASLNSSLIAKLAAKDARIAELEQQAEFHVKMLTGGGSAAYLGELAEAKARIAELKRQVGERETELEAVFARAERAEAELNIADGIIAAERARAECAEAKIAEAMDRLCYTAGECDLVTACEHWVANFHETEARAKRAEAALSFYADERNWHTPPHCYSAAVSDCGTKARVALDHSLAGEKP